MRDPARLAAGSAAKSAEPVAPALEQVGDVEDALLAAQFLLLVDAALALAQSLERLTLAIGPLVFLCRSLAFTLEALQFSLVLQTERLEIFAKHRGELKFGGSASLAQCGVVGRCRRAQKAVELGQGLLQTCHLQASLAQAQGALPLHTLAKS